MKYLKISLLFSFSLLSFASSADHLSTDAAIGGGIGGAAGGFLGAEIGGRQGAIIGSAAGAALGSAISTQDHHGRYRNYPVESYIDYEPKYKKHKKYKKSKGCPPGLAMQGRC